jgi:GT2 family glycosyltransferase
LKSTNAFADRPFVDLSIVTFNSEQWLSKFFKSLLRQRYPIDRLHLRIRDNGSTDTTRELVASWYSEHGAAFASVTLDCGENVGFGRGHNVNLAAGGAPFLLVTNVDLEFAVDAIERAILRAVKDSDDVAAWEFRQKPYEHPKYYNPLTLDVSWASSACVLFRRDALVRVGGYEPRLFLYGEDVELSYRLRDNGYRLRYCVDAVCWHYTYESANQIKPAQFFGSTVANVLLRLRYGTLREALVGLAMYAALFFVPVPVPGRIKGLLANAGRIIRDGSYFARTRRSSSEVFPFNGWDYEMARDGAFYEFKEPPTDLPLVSIIVRTCKGRMGRLREAVQSVLNQTYRRIELVVVEDGSEYARAFLEQVAEESKIENVVYQSIPAAGRCVAGNVGLAAARGEFANFLDDDDLLFADHVEVLATELLNRPPLGAVYGLALEVETEIISDEPWEYRELRRFVSYRESFSRAALWHHNYIPIQAIMFRRQLYEQHGGFNVALDRLEDWDLWVRYSQEHDYLLVDKVTSLYRVPAIHSAASSRQKELDDYYAKALAARSDLRVTLSPNQVLEYARELAHIMYPVAIPRNAIRSVVRRIPGARYALSLARSGRSQWTKVKRKSKSDA